jgi:lipopolysaccharide export system permease protein
MRVTRYDRYLARNFLAVWLRSSTALCGIVVLVDLFTHRWAGIVQRGVPASVVASYYAAFVPEVLIRYQVAALSAALAGLLVLGRAAQNGEVTALLAAGVGMRRIALAPLLCGVAVGVGVFAMNETVGTLAAKTENEIGEAYFNEASDQSVARAGLFWAHLPGEWRCNVETFNRRALTAETVHLYRILPDRHEQYRVRRMYWDPGQLMWMLEDGTFSVFDRSDRMRVRTERVTLKPAPITDSPERLLAHESDPRELSSAELAKLLAFGKERNIAMTRLAIAYYQKFSTPALAAVMALLAVPFALRVRRGGLGAAVGLCIGLVLSYVLVAGALETLGQAGRMPPLWAAWGALIGFGTLGIIMFARIRT